MGFNRKIKTMVNKIGIKDTYKESGHCSGFFDASSLKKNRVLKTAILGYNADIRRRFIFQKSFVRTMFGQS